MRPRRNPSRIGGRDARKEMARRQDPSRRRVLHGSRRWRRSCPAQAVLAACRRRSGRASPEPVHRVACTCGRKRPSAGRADTLEIRRVATLPFGCPRKCRQSQHATRAAKNECHHDPPEGNQHQSLLDSAYSRPLLRNPGISSCRPCVADMPAHSAARSDTGKRRPQGIRATTMPRRRCPFPGTTNGATRSTGDCPCPALDPKMAQARTLQYRYASAGALRRASGPPVVAASCRSMAT
jgi:hypothetical protein